jgi:D-hexose-6-phosphate mutarotase
MTHLDTLNEQFGLTPQLVFKNGPGGLTVAEINNDTAMATVVLQGAHVLSFQPHGQQPVLWVSQNSYFTAGKAIRGGIPVCWPWFANHPADPGKPAHGFARTSQWSVLGSELTPEGATHLRLGLTDTSATRALWPHPFQLELSVMVGADLQVELLVRNPEDTAFTCTEALHSYFSVSDITNITLKGLEGGAYLDKVAGNQRRNQTGPVTISGETDRVYLETMAECVIVDLGWQRQIRVAKQGSRTTVVWNPWAEKARHMADFGAEEYRQMVCVETANAGNEVITVPAGGEHRLQTTIRVEPE